jgi:uncharacterized protein (DUF433 family)
MSPLDGKLWGTHTNNGGGGWPEKPQVESKSLKMGIPSSFGENTGALKLLSKSGFSCYSYPMETEHFEELDRITQNPAVMGGKPCIRGMRVTVGMIVGQIGAGVSVEELLNDYPYLEREDIMQALQYAAALAQWREVALTET